jgi:hypothetical protein
LYSVTTSRRIRCVGCVSNTGGKKKLVQDFGRKCKGKERLGRTKRRWKDNIKLDLAQIGQDGFDRIRLA